MKFTRDEIVGIVNFPPLAEHRMWLRVDNNNLIFYPFPSTIEVLTQLDRPVRELLRFENRGHYAKSTYNSFVLLFRLGIVEQLETKYGVDGIQPKQYHLTLYGKTALAALKQGKVWDTIVGPNKLETTRFWQEIMHLDLNEPEFSKAHTTNVAGGLAYWNEVSDIPRAELYELAQHPRLQLVDGHKAFLQSLILNKLEHA